MKTSRFTPGPWSVGEPKKMRGCYPGGEYVDIPLHVGESGNRGNAFGSVSLGGPGATSGALPDVMANARLIAAAPEMYEALKAYEALENQRDHCEDREDRLETAPEACGECFPFADDARCKIRAVIAKVEGK